MLSIVLVFYIFHFLIFKKKILGKFNNNISARLDSHTVVQRSVNKKTQYFARILTYKLLRQNGTMPLFNESFLSSTSR